MKPWPLTTLSTDHVVDPDFRVSHICESHYTVIVILPSLFAIRVPGFRRKMASPSFQVHCCGILVLIYTVTVFAISWALIRPLHHKDAHESHFPNIASRIIYSPEEEIAAVAANTLAINAEERQADEALLGETAGYAWESVHNPEKGLMWQARTSVDWDRGYHYYPFQDMFRPFELASTSFKSLVLFTAGRSGMANVDSLVTAWGLEHFDYVLMIFDDSSSEWSRFEWYQHIVSITAHRQAKLWFYKRFASPWLVKGYRYIHFVDSDAGSPADSPFDLAAYEALLHDRNVVIGQPATAAGGRSSDHPISRVQEGSMFRWTSFVENGPIFSIAQRAFECVWRAINADFVSGWGIDFGWCQYAAQVCGYSKRRTCAIVDAHYIVHLDKRTASAHLYHNLSYKDHGRRECDLYRERFASIGVKGFMSFEVYEAVPYLST